MEIAGIGNARQEAGGCERAAARFLLVFTPKRAKNGSICAAAPNLLRNLLRKSVLAISGLTFSLGRPGCYHLAQNLDRSRHLQSDCICYI